MQPQYAVDNHPISDRHGEFLDNQHAVPVSFEQLIHLVTARLVGAGCHQVLTKQPCGDAVGLSVVNQTREARCVEINPEPCTVVAMVERDFCCCDRVVILSAARDEVAAINEAIAAHFPPESLERITVAQLSDFLGAPIIYRGRPESQLGSLKPCERMPAPQLDLELTSEAQPQ